MSLIPWQLIENLYTRKNLVQEILDITTIEFDVPKPPKQIYLAR